MHPSQLVRLIIGSKWEEVFAWMDSWLAGCSRPLKIIHPSPTSVVSMFSDFLLTLINDNDNKSILTVYSTDSWSNMSPHFIPVPNSIEAVRNTLPFERGYGRLAFNLNSVLTSVSWSGNWEEHSRWLSSNYLESILF